MRGSRAKQTVMAGRNENVRIKREPVIDHDEETQHLYDNDNAQDVKPAIETIEISSDENETIRPVRIKRRRRGRLTHGEFAAQSQTDGAMEKKDACTNTDAVSLAESGVNTDSPPKTAEIGVSTDAPPKTAEIGVSTDAPPKTAEIGVSTNAPPKTAEIGVSTDAPPKTAEIGVFTDAPPKTAEIGVSTDAPPKTAEIVVSTDDITASDVHVDKNDGLHPTPSSSGDTYFQCTICSCYYVYINSLQNHYRTQHNKTITEQRKVPYLSNCRFCPSSYVFETYNKHIKRKHEKKFTEKHVKSGKVGPYECIVCGVKFVSYNAGKRHKRIHENIQRKQVLRKLKTEHETPGKVIEERKKLKMTPSKRGIIPKNVLFQCPKCELNFFTYRHGLRHRVACEKGDKIDVEAKCTTCEKKFLQCQLSNHYFQHSNTDVFHIEKVVEGIEHKIMYRCLNCKVCMDEKGSRLHVQSGCEETEGETCSECQQKIDGRFATDHKNAHEYLELTNQNIILVDIFNFNG